MLSLIVPTLNERDNVARLITHLKRQMKKRDEIIVVDGYSKDGTANVAKKLGAKVILQKPMGIGAAKTEGAKHAKNDVLVFFDADCIPSRTFLQKVRQHFDDPKVEVVGGLDFYPSDSATKRRLYNTFSRIVFYFAILVYKLTGKYWVASNNSAYRKDTFFRAGGYRPVFVEDAEMMLRLPPSRNVRYDASMTLLVSSRRFKEKGFIGTVFSWVWGDILVLGKRTKYGKGYRKA
jgi:glycosyltransferase involved in cell wall biosynthesis